MIYLSDLADQVFEVPKKKKKNISKAVGCKINTYKVEEGFSSTWINVDNDDNMPIRFMRGCRETSLVSKILPVLILPVLGTFELYDKALLWSALVFFIWLWKREGYDHKCSLDWPQP